MLWVKHTSETTQGSLYMSDKEENKTPLTRESEQHGNTKDLTPEELEELEFKKRLEQLRKRDPFLYR